MDKICVVVPIYNVDRYLVRCLDSIINQTYKNLQIILVDDGSTDKSSKICDEYEKKDNRIEVIHKKNGGLSSARNKGIESCKGKYICFIDSDDYIENDMIEYLYNLIKKYSAEISICNMKKFTDNYNIKNHNQKERIVELKKQDALRKMINLNEIIYPNAMNKLYLYELFESGKIVYPINRLYEDMLVTAQLFGKAKKIVSSNMDKYYYYMREESISNSEYTEKELDHITMSEELLSYIDNYFPELNKYYRAYHSINMLSVCNKIILSRKTDKVIEEAKKFIKDNKSNIIFNSNLKIIKKVQLLLFTYMNKLYIKIFLKLKE